MFMKVSRKEIYFIQNMSKIASKLSIKLVIEIKRKKNCGDEN